MLANMLFLQAWISRKYLHRHTEEKIMLRNKITGNRELIKQAEQYKAWSPGLVSEKRVLKQSYQNPPFKLSQIPVEGGCVLA